MNLAAALLAAFVAASLLPEALAFSLGHMTRAWEYVMDGALVIALIFFIAATYRPESLRERRALFVALSYGLFEAGQRPACRLVFPMDRPVGLPEGQFLCDVAGLRTSQISMLVAAVAGLFLAMER